MEISLEAVFGAVLIVVTLIVRWIRSNSHADKEAAIKDVPLSAKQAEIKAAEELISKEIDDLIKSHNEPKSDNLTDQQRADKWNTPKT